MFAEAASNKDIILYGPAIKGHRNIKRPDNRVELIRQTVTRHAVKCIFRLEPQIYENLVKKESVWHRLSEVMWLRSEDGVKIPNEI